MRNSRDGKDEIVTEQLPLRSALMSAFHTRRAGLQSGSRTAQLNPQSAKNVKKSLPKVSSFNKPLGQPHHRKKC